MKWSSLKRLSKFTPLQNKCYSISFWPNIRLGFKKHARVKTRQLISIRDEENKAGITLTSGPSVIKLFTSVSYDRL
jgi:hypothetical protein